MDYPINQSLPPLTRDAPDALLAAWIARNPGFLAKAQTAATSAWTAARALPGLATRADGIWTTFVTRARQQAESVAQLRVAVQAHAVLRALASLPQQAQFHLGDRYPSVLGRPSLNGTQIAEKVRADVRAALGSHPDLAWFQSEDDARLAALEAAAALRQADHEAACVRERPAVLLKALRTRKIAVALSDEGKITVPAGTALSDADRAAIKLDRDAIAALLRAEAAAAAPVVVA